MFSAWPRLNGRLDPVPLGNFPTPVERLSAIERELGRDELFVKRDDLSSALYGGNKVRTLELLFALARAERARTIIAVGAYGSNHATATALHAPRADLLPAAVLFPQPASAAALENLRVTAARCHWLLPVPHWSLVPWGMWRARGPERMLMVPGGATPDGALGYVAAAFELAAQVAAGELPQPRQIVVGVGSTCTSAGLLVGLTHATRLGLFAGEGPELVSVRVSPWPVTSRFRILRLAERTARRLAELAQSPALVLDQTELGRRFRIDGSQLGDGYGKPSPAGARALDVFQRCAGIALDTTYSAKAAAGWLALAARKQPGPLLFWSTKSTAALPPIAAHELERAPVALRRWIAQAAPRESSR